MREFLLRPGHMPPPRPFWRCQVIESMLWLPGYSTCKRHRWHRGCHDEQRWRVTADPKGG